VCDNRRKGDREKEKLENQQKGGMPRPKDKRSNQGETTRGPIGTPLIQHRSGGKGKKILYAGGGVESRKKTFDGG